MAACLPRAWVESFVTNRGEPVPAHGTADMPVWGPTFRSLDTSDARVTIRIANVVAYLESIQAPGGANSFLPGQPPELRLVQQRDPVPLLAQPLDLHQLEAGVLARRLQRVRPAADDDRRLRRRSAVDDRAGALRGADGLAALAGSGCR